MSHATEWFRNRLSRRSVSAAAEAEQAKISLEETKAEARQYLEQAGYYEGRAPHVVSGPHIGSPSYTSPSTNAAGSQTPPQPESSDDGDTGLALAAAITIGLELNKSDDAAISEFPGFSGGESGGGGAGDAWDSPR